MISEMINPNLRELRRTLNESDKYKKSRTVAMNHKSQASESEAKGQPPKIFTKH